VDEHRHRWSVVDFYVDQDRPMMHQACSCGAVRGIRAWDHFWDPQAPTEVRQPTAAVEPE
jgi:hypothetical protein